MEARNPENFQRPPLDIMLRNVQELVISYRVPPLLIFLSGLEQSRGRCSALSPESVISGLFTYHLQYRSSDND